MAIRTHWAMRCLCVFGVEPAAYQPFASYAIQVGVKSAGDRVMLLHRPSCDFMEGFASAAVGCCTFRRLVPTRSLTVNCSSPIEFLAALLWTDRAVQHLAVVTGWVKEWKGFAWQQANSDGAGTEQLLCSQAFITWAGAAERCISGLVFSASSLCSRTITLRFSPACEWCPDRTECGIFVWHMLPKRIGQSPRSD